MEDSGLAPSSALHLSVPHVAAASLVLAGPCAVISFKQEHLSAALAAQEEEDNELRVIIDSKERLRWSPQLHQRFCDAVESLGGCAVAKPKDIVHRMNVPGLTLAHVKSHLQKYRQQEGVTFVAHAPRHPVSGMRRMYSGYGAADDSWSDAPPAKRYCPDVVVSQCHPKAPHGMPVAPPAQQQHAYATPSSPGIWGALQQQQAAAAAAVPPAVPASEPLQQFFQVLSGAGQQQQQCHPAAPLQLQLCGDVPLPALPPMMPPALVQPQPGSPPAAPAISEKSDRLHELADLALAQHEELLAQEETMEDAAAALHDVRQQLQQAAPARADALAARQQQLGAELSRHMAQQAALLAQLAELRRCTQEFISSPQLAAPAATAPPAAGSAYAGMPPPPQQAAQPAAAAAAPGLLAALPAAAGAATVSPHLASLVAMVAAAAAANYSAAACVPAASTGAGPANAAMAQLQQLLLSVRH